MVSPTNDGSLPVRVFSGAPNDNYRQLGSELEITDEQGRITQARISGDWIISLINKKVRARIDGDLLRFKDGTIWQRN